jgi:zinc protease
MTSITPFTREPDTKARQLKRLPRWLALAMLNRRFSVLAKKRTPVCRGRRVSRRAVRFPEDAGVDLTCKPEDWAAALAVGEQELPPRA